MNASCMHHVSYKIMNAPVHTYPFAHVYVETVFPEDFYAELIQHLPGDECYRSNADTYGRARDRYRERYVILLNQESIQRFPSHLAGFWGQFTAWFLGSELRDLILEKFRPYFGRYLRRAVSRAEVNSQLVRDRSNYAVGPHTDAPTKLVSLLFYLPTDDRLSQLGTSIFVPRDRTMTCAGRVHHAFDKFEKVNTARYKPNALFGFVKSNRSFHGVERIDLPGVERNVLLYNIRLRLL